MTGRKKVCVVGQYLNMAYFGGNAVGQTLKLNGTTFTVVGVMAQKDSQLEEGGTDDCVFLPFPRRPASALPAPSAATP